VSGTPIEDRVGFALIAASTRAEEIAAIACLPPQAYANAREPIALGLGLEVTTLDAEVNALRKSIPSSGAIGEIPPARDLVPVELYQDDPKATAAKRTRVVLRTIHEIASERREPKWLLYKILEANVLAVLAGPRSTFKSFIALHWAMQVAEQKHPVVILSGEGAGLDRRVDAWMRRHGREAKLADMPIHALERALNLNMAVDLGDLCEAISSLPRTPELILIDTLSKFSAGIDENNNSEMAQYLAILSAHLRDEFRSALLLVAHSGHGDAKRPRGAYALMANPDCEYIVDRPDKGLMDISVSRERFKDSPALDPLGYRAEVADLARVDSYGDPITSLALVAADAPSVKTAQQPRGKAQRELLAHLRSIRNVGPGIWTIGEMRELCRGLGQVKGTARSAVEWLTTSGFLTPTVGGYRISDDAG
jgi:hypothetical protein